MPQNDVELDPGVARQILSYFVRNRKAVDTLEGVARWRLLEEQVNRSVRQTEAALDWLVEQGFLEEVSPPSTKVSLFRLNSQRHDEALSFLSGHEQKKRARPARKKQN